MNIATLPAGSAACERLETDLCVVGGGMAGLCAAIAAARRGCRVALLQDRPVLGGNASSEVRMWICGAHGRDAKETGILEEILLENCWRNSAGNYSLWDTVLYEKARFEPRLELLLNCAVCEVEMGAESIGGRIAAVRAWHLTRQCWIRVEAAYFADCSGDSVLRLSGAETRWGRESRAEFGEPLALEAADRTTMGNTLLLQLREIDPADHVPFVPPEWAHRYPLDHQRLVAEGNPAGNNFWWLEIGGRMDTIGDADRIRDELYRIALGTWAWIKNHPDGRGQRWELEWLGALPGKRENVRYVGDLTLRQQDIEDCGRFPDVVCHGGWTIDDHPPGGFEDAAASTRHAPAPSPYGIPYRCLYSATVANLFCAGRNISCTHLAMSSTRVMATCATMGQAVGTAAAIALRHATTPRGVHDHHLEELQRALLDDDQFLPGRSRPIAPMTLGAEVSASRGDPAPLVDGIDRRLGDEEHCWEAAPGDWLQWTFAEPTAVERLRLVGDSQLHRSKRMPCSWKREPWRNGMPPTLPQRLRIEGRGEDGRWSSLAEIAENRRRLLLVPIVGRWRAIRVSVLETWGAPSAPLFAAEVGRPAAAGAIAEAPWTSRPVMSGARA